MALSETTKANINNIKRVIESLKGDIERFNRTIKDNNSKKGSKSAGDWAKQQKAAAQEKIKRHREEIARLRGK